MKYILILLLAALTACHEKPIKQITVHARTNKDTTISTLTGITVDPFYKEDSVMHAVIDEHRYHLWPALSAVCDTISTADIKAMEAVHQVKKPVCDKKIHIDYRDAWTLTYCGDGYYMPVDSSRCWVDTFAIMISDNADSLRSWYNAFDAADTCSGFSGGTIDLRPKYYLNARPQNEYDEEFPRRTYWRQIPDSTRRKIFDSLVRIK